MFVTPGYAAETVAEGGTHAVTGAEGGHGGGGAFPPFDAATFPSQLLWLAITFGLFYLFLKNVVLPRIGGILEVRRDRIAQDLDHAALMKEQADEALAAYEQDLATARSKAGEIGQKARDEAKAEAEAERSRVTAALDDKLAKAEAEIAAIKTKAMSEVGSIASDTTSEIVKSLIGGTVTKAEVDAALKAVKG
jgi:F-type H+-transporting ATPase subunit b